MIPLEWINDALCAQVGTEIFFPESGQSPKDAIKVCERCTVINECLTHAITLNNSSPLTVTGVWGGTTERQRRQLRRMKGAA